jgi:hypothetical protein
MQAALGCMLQSEAGEAHETQQRKLNLGGAMVLTEITLIKYTALIGE